MMKLENQQLLLKERPGSDFLDNIDQVFTLAQSVVPELKENEFLVRVDFLSIDPIMRVWMTGAPTYLPILKPGQIMHSYGCGEVIASRNSNWRKGDKCVGNTGIQQYCVIDKHRLGFLFKVPHNTPPNILSFYLPLLNNWFVAYQGIVVDGRIKQGDTCVISSAAGATGIVCIQLAKQAGAKVVAIAGSDDKCQFLQKEFGVDETINYKDISKETFFAQLKRCCPQGIDVYFDNVGDKMLDDVLRLINLHGRISLCGASSNYDDHKNRKGIANYSNIVVKRVQMKGVLAVEVAPIAGKVIPELISKVQTGEMKSIEIYFDGISKMTEAMKFCFKGSNVGKVLVRVSHQVVNNPKL